MYILYLFYPWRVGTLQHNARILKYWEAITENDDDEDVSPVSTADF